MDPRSEAMSPDAAKDVAADCAARRDLKVPSCRGRRLPVSVSMPGTRTTHRSRCFWTVGRPVCFHGIGPLLHTFDIHCPFEHKMTPLKAGSSKPVSPGRDQVLASALGRTRTPNLLIRSQTLYPIELRAQGNRQNSRRSGADRSEDHEMSPNRQHD